MPGWLRARNRAKTQQALESAADAGPGTRERVLFGAGRLLLTSPAMQGMPSLSPRRTLLRAAAWSVHAYTAAGAAIAFLALDAVWKEDFRAAFWLLAAAMFIDATDGTLARLARVKELLPRFDGSRLDDIVDYLNYVVVPIVLARAAGLLPADPAGAAVAVAPLLASAYGFAQTDAKTPDCFFTGFPSYWNVVVLYLFALHTPPGFNAAVLLTFSLLVFIPIRYLYPSRSSVARTPTLVLGVVWGVMMLVVLARLPDPPRALTVASLFYPAYYVAVSLWATWQRRRTPEG